MSHHDGLAFGPRASGPAKSRQAGRPLLEHTQAISDFAIGLTRAVAASPVVALGDGPMRLALLAPTTRDAARPCRLSVPVVFQTTRHSIGIEPDHVLPFAFPAARRRVHFLVEIGRGTMPVERPDFTRSSIIRKFLANGVAPKVAYAG